MLKAKYEYSNLHNIYVCVDLMDHTAYYKWTHRKFQLPFSRKILLCKQKVFKNEYTLWMKTVNKYV